MMNDPSAAGGFESRHIGPSPQDVSAMLETIGVSSLDALIAQTIPDDIRQHAPLDLGAALSETEALEQARQLAARNLVLTSLIGQGYYGTILPSVIQRNILENPAWYTAYTPYQPEISQGRLEALLNFQTMIADLTALDIANASLLDEGHGGGRSDGHGAADLAVGAQGLFRRPGLPPPDARRLADPRRSVGLADRHRRPHARPPSRCDFWRPVPVPRHVRRCPRFSRADREAEGCRCTLRVGSRSARTDAAQAARRARRRYCDRFDATFRRPDGLRRSARGLHRHEGRAQARATRTARRRFRRQPWQ